MKKIIFIIISVILVSGFALMWRTQSSSLTYIGSFQDESGYKKVQVEIKGNVFDAFVADTERLRSQGLGGFTGLKAGEAMLFVFDTPDTWSFWMKDMLFPIDIVWIDENFKIIYIKTQVSPDTFPKSFAPKDPALYVLELPAGTVNALWLKVGDQVSIVR